MAIKGLEREQYRAFLEKGGTLQVEIDAADISDDQSFRQAPEIKPVLTTGFELPPTPSILDDPKVAAASQLYGKGWTSIIVAVYQRRGKIMYKKLPNGRFLATMTI